MEEEQALCKKDKFLGDMGAPFKLVFNFKLVLKTGEELHDAGSNESEGSNEPDIPEATADPEMQDLEEV